jgi:hypothetical protein
VWWSGATGCYYRFRSRRTRAKKSKDQKAQSICSIASSTLKSTKAFKMVKKKDQKKMDLSTFLADEGLLISFSSLLIRPN